MDGRLVKIMIHPHKRQFRKHTNLFTWRTETYWKRQTAEGPEATWLHHHLTGGGAIPHVRQRQT